MGKYIERKPSGSNRIRDLLIGYGPPAVVMVVILVLLSTAASDETKPLYLIAGFVALAVSALFIYWRLCRR